MLLDRGPAMICEVFVNQHQEALITWSLFRYAPATGSVDPNIERLRKQQPGADGARLKLRKKTAWSGYDKAAFDAAPAVLQERVLRACLSSVRCKVNASTGQPEPDFAAHLETSRELLLDCAEAVNWAVAALIPHTFTQTLTLLDYKEQLPFFLRDGECHQGGVRGEWSCEHKLSMRVGGNLVCTSRYHVRDLASWALGFIGCTQSCFSCVYNPTRNCNL